MSLSLPNAHIKDAEEREKDIHQTDCRNEAEEKKLYVIEDKVRN
jgi:hypothetical protein